MGERVFPGPAMRLSPVPHYLGNHGGHRVMGHLLRAHLTPDGYPLAGVDVRTLMEWGCTP